MLFNFASQELVDSDCAFLSGVEFVSHPCAHSLVHGAAHTTFTAKTRIASYNPLSNVSRYLVMRGKYAPNANIADPRSAEPAVCKLAWCEWTKGEAALDEDSELMYSGQNESLLALRKEVEYYNGPLKRLQGDIVPHLNGYYESDILNRADQERTTIKVVCLITSDCGIQVGNVKENTALQDNIMRLTLSLHEVHVDLHPKWRPADGIVQKDGSDHIYAVGFTRAIATHHCDDIELAREMFRRYRVDRFRVPEAFGCRSLYEIAHCMKWLTPGTILAEPFKFSVFEFHTATEMLDSLEADFPGSKDDEDLKKEINHAIRYYRDTYETRLRYVVDADPELEGHWPPVADEDVQKEDAEDDHDVY